MWQAWEKEETCTGFWWEKPEGKRALQRQRHRWEDGIKIVLKVIGWGSVEWIYLARDSDHWRAVVNAMMNLQVLAQWSQLLSQLSCVGPLLSVFSTVVDAFSFDEAYD
jgi:hypothetical protein